MRSQTFIGYSAPSPSISIFSYSSPCSLAHQKFSIADKQHGEFLVWCPYTSIVPICVSIFANVTEQEDLTTNMTEQFKVAQSHSFEQHKFFPPSDNGELYLRVPVDLDLLAKLVLKPNHKFPENCRYRLVIRVEPQPFPHRFVSAYYFDFMKIESKIHPKLIRQKIELKNQSYIVGEIYGIESVSGGEVVNQGSIEQLCKICMDQVIEIIALPCRHMCLCLACAKLYNESNSNMTKKMKPECPICLQRIKGFVHLKLQDLKVRTPH
jgi:hypothetical protein